MRSDPATASWPHRRAFDARGIAPGLVALIVAGCAQAPTPTPAPVVTPAPSESKPAPTPGPRFDPNLPRVGVPVGPTVAAAPAQAAEPRPPPLDVPGCQVLDLVEQLYQDRGPIDTERTWQHFAPCLGAGKPTVPQNSGKPGAAREFEAAYSVDTALRKLSWSEKRRYDYFAGGDTASLIRLNVNFERLCVKITPVERLRVKLAGSKAEIVRRAVYNQQRTYPPGYERISADRSRVVFYAIDDQQCVRGVVLAHGVSNFRFYPAAPPIKRMGAGKIAPP